MSSRSIHSKRTKDLQTEVAVGQVDQVALQPLEEGIFFQILSTLSHTRTHTHTHIFHWRYVCMLRLEIFGLGLLQSHMIKRCGALGCKRNIACTYLLLLLDWLRNMSPAGNKRESSDVETPFRDTLVPQTTLWFEEVPRTNEDAVHQKQVVTDTLFAHIVLRLLIRMARSQKQKKFKHA